MATEQVLHVPHSILNSAPISGKLAKLVLLRQYYCIWSNFLQHLALQENPIHALIEDVQRDAVALHSVSSRNYHAGKGSLRTVSRLGWRHHSSCGVANSFKQVTFWPLPHPHKPSQHICPFPLAKFGEVLRSIPMHLGLWNQQRLGVSGKGQALVQSQHGCRYYTWRAKMGRAVQLSS